jgi:hypothetical protein
MTLHLCTSNPLYDCEDIERRASAIQAATRDLGAELQKRGELRDCRHLAEWMGLNPTWAGELAVKRLGLTDDQLANARAIQIQEWADGWQMLNDWHPWPMFAAAD